MLCDSANVAGSHLQKSRKVGTWFAARCGFPAFLLYAHAQIQVSRCIRRTPVPGLGAGTPGRVITSLHSELHAWARVRASAARGGRGGARGH